MKNLLRVAILSLIIFYSCVSVRFPETIKVDITIPSDFDIDKMQILIDVRDYCRYYRLVDVSAKR